MRHPRLSAALLIFLLGLGLAACGQKGGLTRPEPGAGFTLAR